MTIKEGTVFCDDVRTTVTIEDSYRWTSTGERSLLTAIAAELEAGVNFDVKAVEFGAKIRAVIKAQATSSTLAEREIKVTFKKDPVIVPKQCFDQTIRVVVEQDTDKISGTRPGTVYGRNSIDPFDIVENKNPQLRISAIYNESCNPPLCRIDGKMSPVLGEDDKQLWAKFKHGLTEYYLPLYWDRNFRIIDVINKLPEEVRPN